MLKDKDALCPTDFQVLIPTFQLCYPLSNNVTPCINRQNLRRRLSAGPALSCCLLGVGAPCWQEHHDGEALELADVDSRGAD